MARGKKNTAGAARSMTGFGKASARTEAVQIDVELRSVNSRFLDCNFKIPREYAEFEPALRKSLQETLNRGRVDVFVQRTAISSEAGPISFNRPVFDAFWQVYEEAAAIGDCNDAAFRAGAVQQILARREVLDVATALTDAEREKETLLSALNSARDALVAMRTREGETLAADLAQRIAHVRQLATEIKELSTTSVEEFKSRLEERLRSLEVDSLIDDSRIAAEAAYLAERSDITEELVRVVSHCAQWESATKEYPQGRKFDFILQELGREFNTVASKTQKAEVQALVVDAKSTLEKMREQAANIE